MALSVSQYDLLERAVAHGTRIVVTRRGTPWIVVPLVLVIRQGKEVLQARHPSTGDGMTIVIDDIEHLEVVR
jgi:hypothetical protein